MTSASSLKKVNKYMFNIFFHSVASEISSKLDLTAALRPLPLTLGSELWSNLVFIFNFFKELE